MRLVIFDLDGTIIDSVVVIVETVTAAFEAIGEPVPTEQAIRSISGISAREAMAILRPAPMPPASKPSLPATAANMPPAPAATASRCSTAPSPCSNGCGIGPIPCSPWQRARAIPAPRRC